MSSASQNSGILIVVVGPSGVGKSTLVAAALEKLHATEIFIERVVTYTTRAPRAEESKNAYHFVSVPEFQEMIRCGEFLEWSEAYGNYYGTSKKLLEELEGGGSRIIIMDKEGAQTMQKVYGRTKVICIDATFESTQVRLRKRSLGDFEKRAAFFERDRCNSACWANRVIYNESWECALDQLVETIDILIKSGAGSFV